VDVLFKALAGGLFVVLSALLAETITPKRLAGILAAAPSVALGSLIVTVNSKGHHDAASACHGMAVGAVAFTGYCLGVVPALGRLGAKAGSAAALTVWGAIAALGWWVFR
jgi:uncharacterized membrane protein (GlpM family)